MNKTARSMTETQGNADLTFSLSVGENLALEETHLESLGHIFCTVFQCPRYLVPFCAWMEYNGYDSFSEVVEILSMDIKLGLDSTNGFLATTTSEPILLPKTVEYALEDLAMWAIDKMHFTRKIISDTDLGYLHPGPLKASKPLSNSTISSNR